MSKIKIDSYHLSEHDQVATRSGRDIHFKFDKYFNTTNKNLNLFKIGKQAYYNSDNAKSICQYINIFNRFYDEDKEYLSAMFDIKYQIDSKSMSYGLDVFINDVIEYVLSESMVEKIWKLVDDQYMINLDDNTERIKEDAQVLQFDNCHTKTLMAISMACKLTIPLVCQYHSKRGTQLAKMSHSRGERELSEKEYFYKIFCSYFPLFQGDSNLFNKLVSTATMHVTRTQGDVLMWKRSKNRNVTPTIQISRLMISTVNDLIPKYVFNMNPIILNHVAMRNNIDNSCIIPKDKHDYFEVTIKSNGEELSGLNWVPYTVMYMTNMVNLQM